MWPTYIALAGEEQRAPPVARTAGTLGTQVMRAITRIQELMTPEDPDDEPDLEAAKEELDELYERRFERMNDFEQQTTLNFYTNYWLTLENYPEAIKTFEQLLTIETLRDDSRIRTLSLDYVIGHGYTESVVGGPNTRGQTSDTLRMVFDRLDRPASFCSVLRSLRSPCRYCARSPCRTRVRTRTCGKQSRSWRRSS